MKKIITLLVFILALSIAVAAQTQQKPEQIKFAAGQSATTITGTVAAAKSKWYEARYGANQKIRVKLTPNYKKVGLSIYDANGSLLNEGTDGSTFDMETAEGGVIKIEVAAVKGRVPFTMVVTIKN